MWHASPRRDPQSPGRAHEVLVTGATGYVGSRLIPRLLREGHTVRAAVTDLDKVRDRWWADQVELVRMDVLDADTVDLAVEGVDAVVYLIHGIGGDDSRSRPGDGRDDGPGVRDGGRRHDRLPQRPGADVPEDELSERIASRLEVERILTGAGSGIRTIGLRAAIVTGSGSTSSRGSQISERMPVQAIPAWIDSRVQPIAVVDVVEALAGALRPGLGLTLVRRWRTRADAVTRLLDVYAAVAGLSRPQVVVPGLPTDLVGTLAGAITDLPGATVEALVESLAPTTWSATIVDWTHDLLSVDHELVGVEESFAQALAEPDGILPPADRDPLEPMPGDPEWPAVRAGTGLSRRRNKGRDQGAGGGSPGDERGVSRIGTMSG